MMRFIERNLDVEWLLFIIAILLLMLVLDMLFKRRISTVMLEHHLSKIEKNTRNTINIISDIYDALWDGNVIECNYQSRKATKPNKYEYHPAGIVYRGRISYLVGTFDGSPDKVIYLPLHRFKKVKIIKEKYSIHQHDRIESLTQGLFGYKLNNKNINVQLKFSPSAGAHLLETPISKKQKISHTKDGYISVKASVVDNMELRYWIRAFGHDVEVIKPISLRNDFIKMTKNLSELYEKN